MEGPVLAAMSGGVGFSHLEKASKVASLSGIPHTVVDFRVLCNKTIKFDLLLEKAEGLGTRLIANGQSAVFSDDEEVLEGGIIARGCSPGIWKGGTHEGTLGAGEITTKKAGMTT